MRSTTQQNHDYFPFLLHVPVQNPPLPVSTCASSATRWDVLVHHVSLPGALHTHISSYGVTIAIFSNQLSL